MKCVPLIAQSYICVGHFGIVGAGGFVRNSESQSAVHRARAPFPQAQASLLLRKFAIIGSVSL